MHLNSALNCHRRSLGNRREQAASLPPCAVPHFTALTIGEIRRGVLQLAAGKRRDQLEAWFAGPDEPAALFAAGVLPFDESAALIWARLMAEGKAQGRPRSSLDMIIAAIAEANGCAVVTDNARDFEGIEMLNPLRG